MFLDVLDDHLAELSAVLWETGNYLEVVGVDLGVVEIEFQWEVVGIHLDFFQRFLQVFAGKSRLVREVEVELLDFHGGGRVGGFGCCKGF